MQLTIRNIVSDDEKEIFLDHFEHSVGVRVPRAYLDQGRIVGYFSDDGEMLGGYALIMEPGFRSLLFIPDQVKKNSAFLRENTLESFLEVNCAWLSPKVKSNMDAIRFWMHMRREILACNRTYLLVMYNRKVRYLATFYARLNPRKIYEGPTELKPGEQGHDEVFVGYVRMADMWLSLYRNLYSFARRLILRPARGHKKTSRIPQVVEAKKA